MDELERCASEAAASAQGQKHAYRSQAYMRAARSVAAHATPLLHQKEVLALKHVGQAISKVIMAVVRQIHGDTAGEAGGDGASSPASARQQAGPQATGSHASGYVPVRNRGA